MFTKCWNIVKLQVCSKNSGFVMGFSFSLSKCLMADTQKNNKKKHSCTHWHTNFNCLVKRRISIAVRNVHVRTCAHQRIRAHRAISLDHDTQRCVTGSAPSVDIVLSCDQHVDELGTFRPVEWCAVVFYALHYTLVWIPLQDSQHCPDLNKQHEKGCGTWFKHQVIAYSFNNDI